jgi:integrase
VARETNKLTDRAVKALKPRAKPYPASDGQCLYLLVKPNGSKLWRLRYREPDRTQQDLALGQYPEVTIAEARERARAARLQHRDGVDPAAARKEAKQARKREAGSTFDAVAEAHMAAQSWDPGTAAKARAKVRTYLSPAFGSRPVASITRAEVIAQLQAVEKLGKLDTLRRVRGLAQAIFRRAVQLGLSEVNPASELQGLFKRPKPQKTAAILNETRLGQVLLMFDGYGKTGGATPQVAYALRLLPHLFVRPGNLRKARWKDILWDECRWIIPAIDMKVEDNGDLVVPLSTQALSMLRELQRHTGNGEYLFPGEGDRKKPISENTLNAALRTLDLSPDEVTAHGFRSTARTLMTGVSGEVIEKQLHHKVGTATQQAYNRREYLEERTKMMQDWSDFLDSLKLKAGNTAV